MTDKPSIRSLAGHVLATDEDPEKRRLAAAVLGDDSLTPSLTRTKEELEALLVKIEGVEGQSERAAAIRRQIEAM